jgi:hypothetical protein
VNQRRIIGYRRNGCPIWEIRGGSTPPVEPAGQQQGNDLGDLLGDPPGEDPPGGEVGGTGGEGEQAPSWATAAFAQLEQKFTSEIDRRINGLVQRRATGQQLQPAPTAGQQQQAAPAASGPDVSDVRYARSVFRDTVADSIKLSAAERQFVNEVAPGMIRASFDRTPDPDDAGGAAAAAVVKAVTTLRKAHQDELVRKLEGLGALDRSKLKPGTSNQPAARPGGGDVTSEYAKGIAKAHELAARRGITTPSTTNGN